MTIPGNPDSTRSIRCFIAIWPGAETRELILKFRRELRRQPTSRAVRWTKPEQIHLTLNFLGDIPRDQLEALKSALSEAAQSVTSFELRAIGIGAFPNIRRPSVIWLGVDGELPALTRLQREIKLRVTQFSQRNENSFHPHLTLGRVDQSAGDFADAADLIQAAPPVDLGGWRTNNFELVQSELLPQGACYSTLASFPLRAT